MTQTKIGTVPKAKQQVFHVPFAGDKKENAGDSGRARYHLTGAVNHWSNNSRVLCKRGRWDAEAKEFVEGAGIWHLLATPAAVEHYISHLVACQLGAEYDNQKALCVFVRKA